MADKEEFFAEACSLLKMHQIDDHTPEQTLNRLFHKLAPNAPMLTSKNTVVKKVTKSKQEFAPLSRLVSSERSRDNSSPIIIIDYRGEERLIDGHHRCLEWLKTGDTSRHTAFVLKVKDSALESDTERPALSGARGGIRKKFSITARLGWRSAFHPECRMRSWLIRRSHEQHADICISLANKSKDLNEKLRLFRMAEAWRRLAVRPRLIQTATHPDARGSAAPAGSTREPHPSRRVDTAL